MSWVKALKEWNAGNATWCVPRKGSKEHAEVMAIVAKMKGTKKNDFLPAEKKSVSIAEPKMSSPAVITKDMSPEARAKRKAERQAQRESNAKIRAEEAEKAKAETEAEKAELLEEIETMVAHLERLAKKGKSRADVVNYWNTRILPKINYLGGKYLKSGAAKFEIIEEILDNREKAEKPKVEALAKRAKAKAEADAKAHAEWRADMAKREAESDARVLVERKAQDEALALAIAKRDAENKGKSMKTPLIKNLSTPSLRKSMNSALSGMESHSYKIGLAHPIDYIEEWIMKYMGQDYRWKEEDIVEANIFLEKVLKFIKFKALDATWRGEPQKVILIDDWEML